jgi:hypothetical protein
MTRAQILKPKLSATVVRMALMLGVAGCTQLGPMPATTAMSAVPAERPHVEAQVAAVPGYYLSSAVTKEPEGAAVRQLSASIEPDAWIAVPGLFAGGRLVGSSEGDVYGEPFVGYRRAFGATRRLSAGAIGFGTRSSARAREASYEATRVGAELGVDFRFTPRSRWLELHLLGGGSLTLLDASGRYCTDETGRYGIDCDGEMPARVRASASGAYPALNLGLAFDFAQHLDSYFHGGRLALLFSGGSMPRVLHAEQTDPTSYGALGASLSLGLGAKGSTVKDRGDGAD